MLVYRVACERKRLLIGGKAWGAWCCVAVWVGERWFALISRGRVVVALVFARQAWSGLYFYSCVLHTRSVNTKNRLGLRGRALGTRVNALLGGGRFSRLSGERSGEAGR